ncbi:MAG: M56 family metallopeptidase [Gemmatimonadota bacterium]
MTAEWVVYTLVVSSLVAVAGWLAERGARAQQWPARWIRCLSLAVSLGLPLSAWLLPRPASPVASLPGGYLMGTLPPLVVGAEPAGVSTEALLLSGWAVLSSLLLVAVAVLWLRLALRRRGWPPRMVDGLEVLVSRSTGPAALGVLRGRVVLPEWALSLEPTQRRLLVVHEAEHVRVRDPQLALVGLLACVAVPWNLPLWWQLRRLRLAIEMDCDRRVLRREGDAQRYGELLLAVGHRRTRLALALAEPKSMLERRIRMIANTKGKATLRAAGLTALAGLLLAVACETPAPTEPADPSPTQVPAEAPTQTLDDVRDAPTFTPFTVAPQLENAEEVKAALQQLYPPLLKDAGIGGTANVWFLIDAEGKVRRTVLNRTSGHDALDQAALKVADRMRFAPAMNRDVAAPVWVALDIAFDTTPEDREGGEEAAREETVRALAEVRERIRELAAGYQAAEGTESGSSAAAPFTPVTQQAELTNPAEVREALARVYPPLLRDAGIEGTVELWAFIDKTGRVTRTMIAQSSGREALDQAALRVVDVMKFTPAYNREEAVAAWTKVPVEFSAAGGS